MRLLILSGCVAFVVLITMASGAPVDSNPPKPIYNIDEAPILFEKFIKDFNRVYKDDADKQVHYEEFIKTLHLVNKLNSDPKQTATFDINDFADKTKEERGLSRGLKLH